jgi:Iron permease FTR1 family
VLAALIIVFREVFEAGLIVGIVLAVTGEVPYRNRWIGGGVLAGGLAACLVAAFAGALSELFEGMGQELFNAAILIVAAIMLTWHNVWMARHGKEMAGELRAVGQAVADGSKSLLALAVVVGVAVLREGSEVALFLYGVATSDGGSGLDADSAARAVCHDDRADHAARGRNGGAGSCLSRTGQLADLARSRGVGQFVAGFGSRHRRPRAACADRLHRAADRDAAHRLSRRHPVHGRADAADGA